MNNKCGDQFASSLVNSCKKLETLDLSDISLMTDIGIEEILEFYSKQLKSISIRKAYRLTSTSISLIKTFQKLQKLTLSNCLNITDDTLINIINGIGNNLIFVHLESISIGDSALNVISQKCNKLEQLRLYNIQDFMDIKLLVSSEFLTKLKILIIQSCPLLVYGKLNRVAVSISYLEFLNCHSLSQETIYELVSNCKFLEKFVYAGLIFTQKNKSLLKSKNIRYELYVENHDL